MRLWALHRCFSSLGSRVSTPLVLPLPTVKAGSTTLPSLLRQYLSLRSTPEASRSAVVFLAQAAELYETPQGSRDTSWVRSEPCTMLLRDVGSHFLSLHKEGGGGSPTPQDLTLLSSLQFSLHRLRVPLGPTTRLLQTQCLEALERHVALLPPRGLAQLAVSLSHHKNREARVRELSRLFHRRSGHGAVCPAGVSLLSSALSRAGVEAQGGEDCHYTLLAQASLPLLPHFPHSALVTLCAALCTTIRLGRRGEGRGVPPPDTLLSLVHAIGDEMALRLSLAAEASAGVGARGWGKVGVEEGVEGGVDLQGLGDISDPLQRLEALMARGGQEGGKKWEGRSTTATSSPLSKDSHHTPQRTSPLLPFTVTRCLYSLAAAALFPPHLFSVSLKYLTSAPDPPSSSTSPSSTPLTKGIEGAAMWSSSTPGVSAPALPTSRVSLLSTEEVAKLTWAVARGHTHGVPPLPSLAIEGVWDPVLARTCSSLGKSLGKGKGVVRVPPHPSTPHSSHYASIVWAATTCSTPAVEACALALEHASLCPQAYSLQALAQTLWAGSIQGVTTGGAGVPHCHPSPSVLPQMHRIIEYMVLAAEAAEKKEGGEGGQGGDSSTTPPLDHVAASLLHPSSRGLVRRVQAQLWTAFVALACHESSTGLASLVSLVPIGAQVAWRSAALEVGIAPPTPPKLTNDVCRVLTLAKVRHTVNGELLLHGGAIGGGFTMGITVHQGSKGGLVLDVLGPGAYLNAQDREVSGGQSFEDSASRSSALARVLRPTLVTRVRQEWGGRAGFKVTPLSFAEWDSRPSTDEKLELLALKGVAIPRELL